MRITSCQIDRNDVAAVVTPTGFVPIAALNRKTGKNWPIDTLALISDNAFTELHSWYRNGGERMLAAMANEALTEDDVQTAPPFRRPRKIWGIGLNYVAHAADLSAKAPTGIPGSFMKPDTTIIGHGDLIRIPKQSQKTTAEGELGVIIGTKCRNVPIDGWLKVVAGFTTVIDITAEDILRQNPRYLTVAKSFDSFFSFGPQLVTPDEIADVAALSVSTVINDRVHAENTVANMTFSPAFLVSFLSRVMTLLPGDIISTGTPGAVVIDDGDVVECRISGFRSLVNPVMDLKTSAEHESTE
jgi:2-keto-4-pentenoate hydratase/2-oxohepta-3-ene-1,7-dioic acid hydratase in catechol pathway